MSIRRFAVVVDGEVAGTLSISENEPSEVAQRHLAAYDSDPRIIPIKTEDPVDHGWTYDGTSFLPPA